MLFIQQTHSFELFGHILTLCHMFYKSKKHIFYLLVNIGKITVQLTACEQIHIQLLYDFALGSGGIPKYRLVVLLRAVPNKASNNLLAFHTKDFSFYRKFCFPLCNPQNVLIFLQIQSFWLTTKPKEEATSLCSLSLTLLFYLSNSTILHLYDTPMINQFSLFIS